MEVINTIIINIWSIFPQNHSNREKGPIVNIFFCYTQYTV